MKHNEQDELLRAANTLAAAVARRDSAHDRCQIANDQLRKASLALDEARKAFDKVLDELGLREPGLSDESLARGAIEHGNGSAELPAEVCRSSAPYGGVWRNIRYRMVHFSNRINSLHFRLRKCGTLLRNSAELRLARFFVHEFPF